MLLEKHLAMTPSSLAQRIAQRLLTLTLGVYPNTLIGRPPRTLAAMTGVEPASKPLAVPP
jgi:hypothetical protein